MTAPTIPADLRAPRTVEHGPGPDATVGIEAATGWPVVQVRADRIGHPRVSAALNAGAWLERTTAVTGNGVVTLGAPDLPTAIRAARAAIAVG